MRLYRIERLDICTLVVTDEVAGRLNIDTGTYDWLDDLHQALRGDYKTRAAVEREPGGRAALVAWDAGDDSIYEAADKTWWLRVGDDEDRALIRGLDLRAV